MNSSNGFRKRTTIHFWIPEFQSLNVHVFSWMKFPLPDPKHSYWIREVVSLGSMLFAQLGRLLPAHRLLPLQEFHQDGFKQQMVGPQNWSRGCWRGGMQENAADTNKSVEAAI